MTKEELRGLTKAFPQIKKLLKERNEARKKVNQAKRRLATLEKKYSFLMDIVKVKSNDDPLEIAFTKFFQGCGFTKVKWMNKKVNEDIQIYHNGELILVEVTGGKFQMPDDEKGLKMQNYIGRMKDRKPELTIKGFVIFNHDFEKPYNKRNPNIFDAQKEKDALRWKVGLTTSVEMLRGFLQLKRGDITFDDFVATILRPGIIKFKEIKKEKRGKK